MQFPGLPPTQNNPAYNAVVQQIRANPHVTHLASRCIHYYYQCITQKLFHLTPGDYEEFVSTLIHARRAFTWTPEGPQAYGHLLMTIKR